MGPRFNAHPSIKIRITGKDAGTHSTLTVPRAVTLGDPATKLEAVFETTCGTETFVLAPGALDVRLELRHRLFPSGSLDPCAAGRRFPGLASRPQPARHHAPLVPLRTAVSRCIKKNEPPFCLRQERLN